MTTAFPFRKNQILLGISLMSTAMPMSAWAQTAPPAPTEMASIQVTGQAIQNNEVDYTAKSAPGVLRSDAPLFETAQSITVVTGKQIEERQAKSVAEALDGVAGVTSGAYGRRGWDDFMIRGQITSAQTYVDGLRTQTSTNVLRAEDIFGLSSIDVVKGPTSVGFGLALPGGLVNLTTKRPEADTFYHAGVGTGSYSLKDATVDVNIAPNNSSKGAYRFVAHVSDQNDPTNYVYFKSQYVAGSYNFDLNSSNELSVIASYQHRDYIRNQGVPLNWSDKYGRNIFIGEPDRPYEVDVVRVGSNYVHYFDNGWSFHQNFTVTKGRSWTDSVFAAATATFPLVARQINNQDKDDVNLALDNFLRREFDFGRVKYEIVTGVDAMHERSDYFQRVDNVNALNANNPVYGITTLKLGTPARDVTTTEYAGLYLRNTIKIDNKWIIGLSGRNDWTQVRVDHLIGGGGATNSNTAFTGNASLMYRINDSFAPYASYATSFMPGTDLGVGGTLLKPETGKQTELGMKFQGFDQRLQGYVAAYDLSRQNVTESDVVLGYSVQTGEQVTKGFEAEVAASLTKQWNVSASYSYIPFAKTTESLTTSTIGQRINLVPRNSVGLFTQYYLNSNELGWSTGAGVNYQSARTSQRGVNFVALAGHTVVDWNAGYEAATWGVNLSIKNLFDKDYIQGTTPAATLLAFGSPRTFQVSAKLKF